MTELVVGFMFGMIFGILLSDAFHYSLGEYNDEEKIYEIEDHYHIIHDDD